MIIESDLGPVRTHRTARRRHPEPAPAPLPAGLPYQPPPRPAPVRPSERIIAATLEHAAGPRPAVLVTNHPIRLDTRAGRLTIDSGSGSASRTYVLAPGPLTLARRDALTLAEWRKTLTEGA